MVRVLVVEPHASGHHASYLRWIVDGIVDRGWTAVVATTAEALRHPVLHHLEASPGSVEIHLIADDLSHEGPGGRARILLREWRYWRLFRRTVTQVSAKAPLTGVILPYLDYLFFASSLLGDPCVAVPWCGISMRLSLLEPVHPAKRMPWKWRLAGRVLSQQSCRALFVINPSVQDVPADWYGPAQQQKLRYLPDPAEPGPAVDRDAARASLGIAPEAIAILVYGSIDERKGLDALVARLESDQSLRRYTLVVAGRQSTDMRRRLAGQFCGALRAQGRLRVLDHLLDEAEQAMVFAAADVAWLGYAGHLHMSGVLVLAGRAGLPVIACAGGEIGRMVRRHAIGTAVSLDDPAALSAALSSMLDGESRAEYGARAKEAFSQHRPDNFQAAILGALSAGA